jgi:parallel beta-helix repeat protein
MSNEPRIVSGADWWQRYWMPFRRPSRPPKPPKPPDPPIPPTGSARGPQADVTQPLGSIVVAPGALTIHAAVSAHGPGSVFWLEAGTYPITSAVIPKTGQTFVGRYGAILDGSTWITGDLDDAAFKGVNNGVTGVTIRNLFIQNCPEYGVNAYGSASGWVLDQCELHHGRNGFSLGIGGIASNNISHHNAGDALAPNPALRGGGYIFNSSTGASLINNEIAYNGVEQKFGYGTLGVWNQGLTIARNWVHHNLGNGLWIDGDGAGSVIEDNVIEDNGAAGIDIENGNGAIVRTNTIRRHLGGEGIYVTVSKNTQVSGNLLENNLFGVGLFLDFAAMPPESPEFPWSQDLAGNTIAHNTIRLVAGQRAGLLTLTGAGDRTPYYSNAKQNLWIGNTYYAPSIDGSYFVWDGNRAFAAWNAIPQDATGGILVG